MQAFLAFRPFKLQSEVSILDVIGPGEMRIRLFGTGLAAIAGRDLTGGDGLLLFDPKVRAEAGRIVWAAANKPCGYIVQRQMRRGEFTMRALGIGLPLHHEQSGRTDIVSFNTGIGRSLSATDNLPGGFVTDLKLLRWIDIGAGVPEPKG